MSEQPGSGAQGPPRFNPTAEPNTSPAAPPATPAPAPPVPPASIQPPARPSVAPVEEGPDAAPPGERPADPVAAGPASIAADEDEADLARPDRPAPPSRFRSRLWRAGALLWSLGLLAGGGTAGWIAHERYAPEPETVEYLVEVDRPVVAERSNGAATGTVPNVLGLSEEQGRQVMIDAGLDSASIVVERVPAAGDTERVVNQQPASGSLLGGAVTLFVGVPSTMPDFTGATIAEARAQLSALGARPVITNRFDAATPEGQVLETVPAPGEPLPIDVSLVVSEPASSVFLSQVASIRQDCSQTTLTANGTRYDEALVCRPTFDRTHTMEFAVARAATGLTATIAHDDEGEIGSTALFSVYVDDVLADQWVVPFGEQVEIAVDLSGALRVRLDVQRVGDADERGELRAVWADTRLLGGRTNIEGLLDAS